MRVQALEAPQGGHLGIGKQRCLEDKVWEVTGRGCVFSVWICESHRGDGVRWPSFQAASHIVELCPCRLPWAPGGKPAPTPHILSLRIPPPTPTPQVSSMRQVPVRTGNTHTLSRSWAWHGHRMGLSQALPWFRTLPLSLHCGGLTAQDSLPFGAVMCLCSGTF